MSGIDLVNRIDPRESISNGESVDDPVETAELTEVKEDDTLDSATLPLDTVFDILKNQRRRRVLRYLREEKEETLSNLAEHIAALENEKEVAQLTSSERKRVYVGLYQCHLPRMDDADVIEFDANRGTIKLKDKAAQLDRYLDVSRPQWPLYYGGIAITGAVVHALSWLALGSAVLSSLTVGLVIVAISICAHLQYRSDSQHGHP